MSRGFVVLIPARMASTRLPNKPLADIAGKPMIVRVAQQAQRSQAQQVIVATDSLEVQTACQAHAIDVVMTASNHLCGSDRLAQACTQLALADEAIVVNVQGDEPLIEPALINAVAQTLIKQPECAMSTAAYPIAEEHQWHNPNIVKVVLDARGHALYFSRSPIPHGRGAQSWEALQKNHAGALLRHIGIYGYRVGFLKRFPMLTPAPIELMESLEQLRALWHGERIAVHVTHHSPGIGVDTPEDLEHVRQLMRSAPVLSSKS